MRTPPWEGLRLLAVFFISHSFQRTLPAKAEEVVEALVESAPLDGNSAVGCAIEEQLATLRDDEPRGLELLQLEVSLQRDLVTHAPVQTKASSERKDQPSMPSAATALGGAGIAAAVRAASIDAQHKKQISDFDLPFRSVESAMSLLEVEGHTRPSSHRHLLGTHVYLGIRRFLRSKHVTTVIIAVLMIMIFGLLFLLCSLARVAPYTKMGDHDYGPMQQTVARRSPQLGGYPLAAASQAAGHDQMDISFGGNRSPALLPTAQQGMPSYVAAARDSPVAPGADPGTVPPVCPSLILPHTEARFMIPIDSLMRASGELDIRGTSGRKLLHGNVRPTPEGRQSLALASCGMEEDPRVTVLAPPRNLVSSLTGGGMEVLEIFGKGGQFYGTLEPARGGGAVLKHNGEIVMSLEVGSSDFSSDLLMSASSMDGRLLASAGKNVQVQNKWVENPGETWKLMVKPGSDAVLIAACMLGVLLFGK
jgi:hypothetical protein